MSLIRTTKVTHPLEPSQTSDTASSQPEYFLFAFGDNSSGQLLVPNDLTICIPRRIPKFNTQKVEFVACGCSNSFVLSESGDVYGGGANEQAQVALGTDDDTIEGSLNVPRPCKLERLSNQTIKHVAAGPEHVVAVLDNGAALSYGVNEYGQLGQGEPSVSIHPRPPAAVKSLTHRGGVSVSSCGRAFTLFLTKWGEVWACGDNGSGCLGIPEVKSSPLPLRIPGLAGAPIVQIAAGDEHCLALSLSGTLYAWGRAQSGQLGLGKQTALDDKVVYEPRVVPRQAIPGGKVKRLAAGGAHSLLILSGGKVAACGLNSSGQCGQSLNSDVNKIYNFQCIESLPSDLRWLMLSAGAAHSVLVSASGDVFTFGRNLEGQLGIGKITPFESVPQQIKFKTEDYSLSEDSSLFAYGCAAGDFHTMLAALSLTIDRNFVNTLVRQHSLTRSGTVSPNDVSLPEVPLFRVESGVRPARSTKRIRVGQIESLSKILKTTSIDTMSGLLPVDSQASSGILKWTSNESARGFKVGFRADDLTHMIECASRDNKYDSVKIELKALFSNAARLNCSFLISSRNHELDVGGLEAFYSTVLNSSESNELLALILSAIGTCVSDMATAAKYLREADQVRFVLICLHCPVFDLNPLPNAVGKVLTGLYSIVAAMPCSGRAHIFSTVTSSYPSSEFQRRLVDPARRHVAWTLPRHVGMMLPAVEDLWSLMLFLQLLFLANETVASQIRIDEAGSKRLGKLPPEAFAIEFPAVRAIDPSAELRVLLQMAAAHRQKVEDRPQSAQPVSATTVTTETPSAEDVVNILTRDPQGHVTEQKQSDVPAEDVDEDSAPWKFEPSSVLRIEGPIDAVHRFFLAHTNLLPVSFKQDVVRCEAILRQASVQPRIALLTPQGWQRSEFFVLRVRRSSLVSDALHQISGVVGNILMRPLKVIFDGEEGVDEGGLKREFFRLAIEQLFNPEYGMFTYDPECRSVWFSQCMIEGQSVEFALVGLLLGLAIYNDVLLDLKLAPPTYAKLLNVPTTFEDLAQVNKSRAEGLRKMLDMDCSTEEGCQLFNDAFGMMSMVETIEYFGETREVPLTLGGEQIYLNPDNRRHYAELVADFILNKSIEQAFTPFKRGFMSLCQSDIMKAFRPHELQLLLNGEQTLDFAELRKGARYEGGYTPGHPYILWFWEILEQFTLIEKQQFLYFATGSDRSPIGGLSEIKLLIQRNGSEPIDRLPTALTCFNALLLPEYHSKAKLSKLLKTAIEWGEGFGLK